MRNSSENVIIARCPSGPTYGFHKEEKRELIYEETRVVKRLKIFLDEEAQVVPASLIWQKDSLRGGGADFLQMRTGPYIAFIF